MGQAIGNGVCLRYPHNLSLLILMNTAPASHADLIEFLQNCQRVYEEGLSQMRAIETTERYQSGDLKVDSECYRINFCQAIRNPEHLERLVERLSVNASPEGIRKARAIEHRLYEQTWLLPDLDLLPKLMNLRLPTLVLHGDYDFIPIECAVRIADAIHGSRFILIEDCGHFS